MPCPSCAVPVPLSVDAARWSCGSCGSSDAMPEPVAERLRAAGQVLEAHGVAERQLRGVAKGALQAGSIAQAVFIGLVTLVVAPMALIAVTQLTRAITTQGADFALAVAQIAGLVPLGLVVALQVLFALWLFRRARRRVALAAAALPPTRAGEVGGCHVCGGPLSAGVQGVARCGYCAADNVLDAQVVAAAAASRRVELHDYAGAVAAESGSIGRALGCATLALLGVVAVVPFTCSIPMWFLVFGGWAVGMVVWLVSMGSQPPTPGNRYGLVDDGGRRCVAWLNPYTERWERSRLQLEDRQDIEVDRVEELPLDALLGRELEFVFVDDDRSGYRGTAADPRWGYYAHRDGRTLDGPDTVSLVRTEDHKRIKAPLWKTCLVE